MKRRTKIILGLMTVCAASLTFAAACSSWDTPYETIDKNDYKASVRYDINGGQFASKNNVNIVDGYSLEDAKKGVKLLEPGSDARGEGQVASTPSRTGYFLDGWYRVREDRVDSSGNPLDEDGNLCSVSKKPQGFTYAQKWNFAEDVFKVEDAETSGKQSLTLYAAWVPEFTFHFTVKNGDKVEEFADYSVNPLVTRTLALPYWEDEQAGADKENCSVEMQYGFFPKIEGKTFEKIFDESGKQVEASYIEHTGYVAENGTAVDADMTFLVEFRDGVWYHINSARQFRENSIYNGNYEIRSDLTFDTTSALMWSSSLTANDFTGKIIGIGQPGEQRVLKNISVIQGDYSQQRGGVFGRIMQSAVIENIKFEDVTYNLNAATRLGGGEFGLLAGSIDPNATINNVTVSGTIKVGNIYVGSTNPYANYTVGLLCANIAALPEGKIPYDISVSLETVTTSTGKIYPHRARVENGIVIFSVNEDNTKDPNPVQIN